MASPSPTPRFCVGCSGTCPSFERRLGRYSRPVHSSWRMDETAVSVRGGPRYLYRAVDKHGKTVDYLLRPDRGIAAAQAFFRKALSSYLPRWPRKITLDGLKQSHLALRLLRREHPKWKYVLVRSNQYLNNLIAQDHRAIKRRSGSRHAPPPRGTTSRPSNSRGSGQCRSGVERHCVAC